MKSKEKVYRKKRMKSMRTVLLVAIIFIIVLPVFTVSMFAYKLLNDRLYDQFHETNRQAINAVDSNMELYMDGVENLLNYAMIADELVDALCMERVTENETISKAAKLIRSREGGTSLLLTDGLREALSGEKAAGPIYVLASAGTDEETDGFCADIFGNCVQAEEGNVRYLAGIRKKECDGLEFEKKYRRLLLRRCLGISEPLAELSEGAVATGMEEAVHRAYLQEFAWQGETETAKPFSQEQFFLQLDSGNSRSACAMVTDGLISCGREDGLTCEKNRDYAEQCLKMLSQYSSAGFDAAGPVMQKLLNSGKQLLYGSMDEILRDICGIIEKLCIFSAEQLHTQRHIALRMKKILEEHYQEDLSAERMAELFDYSAAYLGKLFRRENGISIGQYLIGVRMEKAAGLLLGTDMKIVDIAHQVGYADELHFQKLFKKKTGKTPGAFRKERG